MSAALIDLRERQLAQLEAQIARHRKVLAELEVRRAAMIAAERVNLTVEMRLLMQAAQPRGAA